MTALIASCARPEPPAATPPPPLRGIAAKPSQPDAAASEPVHDRASAALAAAAAWKTLVERGLAGEGRAARSIAERAEEPGCDAGQCEWRFQVIEGHADHVGTLHVDARTHEVLWEPNDGRSRRYTIEAFAVYSRDRGRVEDLVAGLPEVKAICERLRKRHGLACAAWAEEQPENAVCGPAPGPADPCLWSVYLGEVHPGSHASRIATFYVDTSRATVVGVSPMECSAMSLVTWRAYLAQQKAGSTPPCPEDVK